MTSNTSKNSNEYIASIQKSNETKKPITKNAMNHTNEYLTATHKKGKISINYYNAKLLAQRAPKTPTVTAAPPKKQKKHNRSVSFSTDSTTKTVVKSREFDFGDEEHILAIAKDHASERDHAKAVVAEQEQHQHESTVVKSRELDFGATENEQEEKEQNEEEIKPEENGKESATEAPSQSWGFVEYVRASSRSIFSPESKAEKEKETINNNDHSRELIKGDWKSFCEDSENMNAKTRMSVKAEFAEGFEENETTTSNTKDCPPATVVVEKSTATVLPAATKEELDAIRTSKTDVADVCESETNSMDTNNSDGIKTRGIETTTPTTAEEEDTEGNRTTRELIKGDWKSTKNAMAVEADFADGFENKSDDLNNENIKTRGIEMTSTDNDKNEDEEFDEFKKEKEEMKKKMKSLATSYDLKKTSFSPVVEKPYLGTSVEYHDNTSISFQFLFFIVFGIPLLLLASYRISPIAAKYIDTHLLNSMCAPVPPGTVFDFTTGTRVGIAPWWVPEVYKDDAFPLVCGDQRKQTKLQWIVPSDPPTSSSRNRKNRFGKNYYTTPLENSANQLIISSSKDGKDIEVVKTALSSAEIHPGQNFVISYDKKGPMKQSINVPWEK